MIKNLLFDLGGVIMDICRENAVKALEGIGMAGATIFWESIAKKDRFLRLKTAQCRPRSFVPKFVNTLTAR